MKKLLAFAAVLIVSAAAFAAPAPVRRPQPKEEAPDLTGTWDCDFGKRKFLVLFSSDGVYRAWEQGGVGSEWVGTWSLGENALVVHEREICEDVDAVRFAWFVRLRRHGPLYGGRAVITQFRDLSDPTGHGADFTLTNKR